MSVLNNIVKSNKGYEIGHISHRKDGDYRKVGKGEWEKVGVEDKEAIEFDTKELTEEEARSVGEYINSHYIRKGKLKDYFSDLENNKDKQRTTEETFEDLKKLAYINGNIKKGYRQELNDEELDLRNRGNELKNDYIRKVVNNPKGLKISVDGSYPSIIYFNKGDEQISFHLTYSLSEDIKNKNLPIGEWSKNPKAYLFENKEKAKEFAFLTREINALKKYDEEEELKKGFRGIRDEIGNIIGNFGIDEKGFKQAENDIRQRLEWAEDFVSTEAKVYAKKVAEAKTPATRKKYEKLLADQKKIDEMESKAEKEKLKAVSEKLKNLKESYSERKKEVQAEKEKIDKKLKRLVEKRDSIEIRDFV